MPRLSKEQLLNVLVRGISDSGWSVLYLSGAREHPFRLQVYSGNESYHLRIYIWNLTHGGGEARPQNEYRIQITGITSFYQVPGERTLILGWYDDLDVFAGFDVRRHRGVLGKSPSIQIRRDCLQTAYTSEFAPCDKGNQEIAIAFRPDFLVEYIRDLEALHDLGQHSSDLAVIGNLIQHPEINDEDIPVTDYERRTAIISVRKKLRDMSFRRRVLTVYNFQCAVCGIQLKLVDAAHIVPVVHENSTDETRNGLALCALHHRAYDQGLITIWDDYSVRLSESKVEGLRRISRDGGIVSFRDNLRPMIILPPAISDRPHIDYIRLGNQIRGWQQ
ncbi:MAG TPA: HNH endonuclease [Ardenticatenaceae bacterium]|jgi:putative restriction endonuclease